MRRKPVITGRDRMVFTTSKSRRVSSKYTGSLCAKLVGHTTQLRVDLRLACLSRLTLYDPTLASYVPNKIVCVNASVINCFEICFYLFYLAVLSDQAKYPILGQTETNFKRNCSI